MYIPIFPPPSTHDGPAPLPLVGRGWEWLLDFESSHDPHPCPLPTRGRETPSHIFQPISPNFGSCRAVAKFPSPLWEGLGVGVKQRECRLSLRPRSATG